MDEAAGGRAHESALAITASLRLASCGRLSIETNYPNRPFRQEVLPEIRNGAGEIDAAVTRYSYGCRMLNTARVMFLDIDLPGPKALVGFLWKLFGKPEPAKLESPLRAALTRMKDWNRDNSDWGWRSYRTRAGLCLLAPR